MNDVLDLGYNKFCLFVSKAVYDEKTNMIYVICEKQHIYSYYLQSQITEYI